MNATAVYVSESMNAENR